MIISNFINFLVNSLVHTNSSPLVRRCDKLIGLIIKQIDIPLQWLLKLLVNWGHVIISASMKVDDTIDFNSNVKNWQVVGLMSSQSCTKITMKTQISFKVMTHFLVCRQWWDSLILNFSCDTLICHWKVFLGVLI